MQELPGVLELRNRAYVFGPQQKRIGWIVAGLTGIALAIAGFLLARLLVDPVVGDALTRFISKRATGSWHAAILLLGTLLLALEFGYLLLAARKERLFLDATGIRLQSPLPRLLQFLYPGWSLKWGEVRRARLERLTWAPGPAGAVLVLSTHAGERRIRPYTWVDATQPAHGTPWQGLRRLQAMGEAERDAVVTGSLVVRYVKARRPDFDLSEDAFALHRPFALEKSSRALIAVSVFFLLVAYAGVDFILNGETYAAAPPVLIFLLGGALVAATGFPWLRRAAVPAAESLVISVLLGLALGAALHPGLLRINQFTDSAGLQAVRYVLQRDFSLVPEREGPPVLRFTSFPEYWLQFSPGSVHEFRMRRGGLEFYQIDMAPVHERTREFYRQRPGSPVRNNLIMTGGSHGA